ncbi:hypothetical protein, partial [Halalkalibacter flavus]|uniref:hypothetical protein n=1 Tax=Halalkalibacter flavus TaxID=3090668 RepID=UPI002FC5D996
DRADIVGAGFSRCAPYKKPTCKALKSCSGSAQRFEVLKKGKVALFLDRADIVGAGFSRCAPYKKPTCKALKPCSGSAQRFEVLKKGKVALFSILLVYHSPPHNKKKELIKFLISSFFLLS